MNRSHAPLIRDLLAYTRAAVADTQRLIVDYPGKSEEADFLMQQLEAFERMTNGLRMLLDASERPS